MASTKFYKTGDGILGRERDRRCPEVLHDDGVWRPYPELDPLHDARLIKSDEAKGMLPKGKPASHLEAAGEMDRPVRVKR